MDSSSKRSNIFIRQDSWSPKRKCVEPAAQATSVAMDIPARPPSVDKKPNINITSQSNDVMQPPSSTPSSSHSLCSTSRYPFKRHFLPEELRRCLTPTLEKLYQMNPEGLPFRQPVDPIQLGCMDYFDIIKKPMDLSTIKRKLDTNQYKDPWEYCDDVWLMFENAWLYNRKTSRVYKYCSKLAEVFEREIDVVMRNLGYCCGRKDLNVDQQAPTKNQTAQPSSSHEQKRLSIQRCIDSLKHATHCVAQDCTIPSCMKMKRVVEHTKTCKRKGNNGCPICKQLIALCCYHAKHCRATDCVVPYCKHIKNKFRQQQMQQQFHQARLMRRRMAVMRNMQQQQQQPQSTNPSGMLNPGVGVAHHPSLPARLPSYAPPQMTPVSAQAPAAAVAVAQAIVEQQLISEVEELLRQILSILKNYPGQRTAECRLRQQQQMQQRMQQEFRAHVMGRRMVSGG